jgi:hypothetical protein
MIVEPSCNLESFELLPVQRESTQMPGIHCILMVDVCRFLTWHTPMTLCQHLAPWNSRFRNLRYCRTWKLLLVHGCQRAQLQHTPDSHCLDSWCTSLCLSRVRMFLKAPPLLSPAIRSTSSDGTISCCTTNVSISSRMVRSESGVLIYILTRAGRSSTGSSSRHDTFMLTCE